MARKNKSLAQNKNVGHLIALAFYIAVGYFLYVAAANMNYVWKWNSIPDYFIYEETKTIEAPADGILEKINNEYFVKTEDENIKLNLDDSFKFSYKIGEDVYEGDYIASKTFTKTGPVLNGLWVTLKISFFAAILTFIIGIIVKIVANIFELDRFVAGVLALGIFFGAYMAEILRGAIQSIDKGQLEAANSLGISKFQAMRYIILPQAFKRALPTLVGEMIALVKDSSLVSVISITDLTKVGKEIVANTFSPFETWIVVALVYLSITSILSYIGHRLEKKMASKGGLS